MVAAVCSNAPGKKFSGGQMFAIAVLALLACLPSLATAQTTTPTLDPNRGNITFTSNFDFTNAYMFRGLVQDDTRLIMWPSVDAGINLHRGSGSIERADLHVGTWNSLNTGRAGLEGRSEERRVGKECRS